ncbi:MAG: transglycosylase SLT domain-containing protein [Candidatus Yanofskybacteria bacterium]|nr:transglycosylase SLT domain-containing protein [Candidatus Yanofskybacteria bacterium]
MAIPRFYFRSVLLGLLLMGALLMPRAALAADFLPLVPCGSDAAGQAPCTPCDLFKTGKNVVDFVMYGVTGPIAAFMIVIAGGMILLGGEYPDRLKQGKQMLTNTLIGVSIILASWLAVTTLIKLLAGGSQYDTWYEFSCPEGLAKIPPIVTATPTTTAAVLPPRPTPSVPAQAGVRTVVDTLPVCATTGANGKPFQCGDCTGKVDPMTGKTFGSIIQQYASGPVTPQLLNAIMFAESSCRTNPENSGAGAYGLMQIQPATANSFRSACGVSERINAAWLMSDANIEKIICVGAAYLKSLVGSCGSSPVHLAANYNGSNACGPSRDCSQIQSCTGAGAMKRWECPWNDPQHTTANTGFHETRDYAPKVAYCTAH